MSPEYRKLWRSVSSCFCNLNRNFWLRLQWLNAKSLNNGYYRFQWLQWITIIFPFWIIIRMIFNNSHSIPTNSIDNLKRSFMYIIYEHWKGHSPLYKILIIIISLLVTIVLYVHIYYHDVTMYCICHFAHHTVDTFCLASPMLLALLLTWSVYCCRVCFSPVHC